MKACVCGGRDVWLEKKHFDALALLVPDLKLTEIHCGMAPGVDACAYAWAVLSGLTVVRYPADWESYGKAAGPRRNSQMAANIDYLVVFEGGRGTQNMIEQAQLRRNIRIIDLRADSLFKDWNAPSA